MKVGMGLRYAQIYIGHALLLRQCTQLSQIDQIAQKAKLTQLYLRPNIILLHAGTNDLNMGKHFLQAVLV